MTSTCCNTEMNGNQCLNCGGCGKCGGYCVGGHDRIPDKKTEDAGHSQLITDLRALLMEAEKYKFHDFKNEKYATPKMTLVKKLGDIATKAMEGKYDN